jgi:hypothetical protein
MKHWILRAAVSVALVALAVPAFGQTSRITGIVTDTAGGVIPGADVEIRHNATGVVTTAVTNHEGVYSFPGIQVGTYTVTVTLEGFKTAVFNDVVLNAGVPTAINARLEVGGLAETVTVEGATALVQTVSSAVSSTINTQQIERMPLQSRNVLDFVTRLPGVETSGGSRQSSISGLPRSAINITLDGINVQDNTLRTTDGFFTIVQPRLDAIEEVTVSMAAGEAVGGGQGAVQIRFTTRSGTNTYSGSLYHYYRNDRFNENTWFNIRNEVDKPSLLQHQRGGRFGGPIRIPGLFDGRGKAFFFLNIENFYQPADVTRNRTILHPRAQQGIFRYDIGGGVVREVNLIELAANNGQTATMDPTIQQLLADIRQATTTTGTVTPLANPLHEQYRYNLMNEQDNWFPTYRVDYNFTDRHRFSTVLNWHKFSSVPDTLNGFEPFYPGFPVMGSQTSRRGSSSNTLRSTFGANVVNEFRVGYQGSPVEFFNEQFEEAIWNQPFGGQGGHHLALNANNRLALSNAGPTPNAQSRNVNTIRVENTLSWMRGSHSISVGGMFDRMDSWNKFRRTVPIVTFGMATGDPALGMFNATNFPGASAAQLTAARNLYALLTGRVDSTAAIARLDAATTRYVYSGLGTEESRLETFGFFAQDSWRLRPNLSLNLGLRYDVQRPFRARNDSYATVTPDGIWGVSGYRPGCDMSSATPGTCNIFKPGEMPGQPTQYHQFMAGTAAYNTDLNNLAPSVGFNWTPERRDGALGRLMGQSGDFVIRGGFARAYQQPGMSDYRSRFSTNPGFAITVARNASLGNLGTLPLLYRESARLAAPPFPEAPEYPNEGLVTNSANMFDPDIQIPYADTWTVGFQRALSRNMAGEVRYVGTRSRNQWTTYNFNELNIIESGILHEFQLAQQNLQANLAAGRGGNFRYFGPGTGTQPLPTILAYFSGSVDPNNPASYGSSLFADSVFLNPLARFNPNPFTFGANLDNNATRRANALAAGLPANLLRANPDKLGGANAHGHGGFSNYNSVQFELRRRLANGFQANASYVYGVGEQSARYSFRVPRETVKRAGLTEGEVTHAFKTDWMLELPFGQGRRFGTNAGGVLDRIIGGWQVHGFLRVQSGVWANFGNVRMVGFNEKDLRNMFKLRINENQRVFMLPQDVVDNTVRAFNTNPTSATGYGALGPPEGRYFAPAMGPDCLESIAAGYGECGTRQLAVRGPLLKLADISVVKAVPIVNRVRAEFRVEMLNAFNWVNFVPVASTSTNAANHEVGSLRGAHLSRVVQLVSRITW